MVEVARERSHPADEVVVDHPVHPDTVIVGD